MPKKIITHGVTKDLTDAVTAIRNRILKDGDKPYATVAKQLQLLDEFQEFELGRFLIQNRGLDGHWTHYVLMYPRKNHLTGLSSDGTPLTSLEKIFLETIPTTKATQQRFNIFQEQIIKYFKENMVLASVPCGVMGDLLTLDYSHVKNFLLVGIDLDEEVLNEAKQLAEKNHLLPHVRFFKKNAWELDIDQEFDLLTSHGLNFYESDESSLIELYRQFYRALKPGGILLTSFLSTPPSLDKNSIWLMDKIDPEYLNIQRVIFSDILQARWMCFTTPPQIEKQITAAGFKNIKIIYDDARIFPTVVAEKKINEKNNS